MRISPLPPPYYIDQKSEKGKNIRLIIGLIILFIVSSFFVYVFLIKKDKTEEKENKSIVKNESELPKENEKSKEEIIIPTIQSQEEITQVKEEIVKEGFLFPSDQLLLNKDDLLNTEIAKIEIIKNEIYARHGYIFKNRDVQKYFESQSWYSPSEEYKPEELNEIEVANLKIISEFLNEKPTGSED